MAQDNKSKDIPGTLPHISKPTHDNIDVATTVALPISAKILIALLQLTYYC